VDWGKTIDTVGEVARKTFTLGGAAVLVFVALSGVYVTGLILWWVVRRAHEFFGS